MNMFQTVTVTLKPDRSLNASHCHFGNVLYIHAHSEEESVALVWIIATVIKMNLLFFNYLIIWYYL